MTDPVGVTLAALFGAVFGSFLNVCIYRLPRAQSIVFNRSMCTACQRQLAWFENIPIVGYVVLGGRCRTCRERIALRYLLVEVLTTLMFGAAWMYYGPGWLLASRLVFGCALVVLFAIDLEHQLLPNVITLPGIVAGVVFSFFTEPGWQASLIGVLLGGGILSAIAAIYYRVRREEGLGGGDIKMLSMIGAFLGWQAVLLTLFLASIAGALTGLALMATGRSGPKHALPFGTFLAMGAACAATVGPAFIAWYVSLL
jgi:leader peptidase (prepilin peptidase)/N-methyltransferase